MPKVKMINQSTETSGLEALSKLLYTIVEDLYKDQKLETEQLPTLIAKNIIVTQKNDLENANKEIIINFLKDTEYFDEDNFKCAITYSFLFEDSFVFLLYKNKEISKYGFNSNAINQWMQDKNNPTCPVTRQPIKKIINGQSEISLKLLECFIEKYQQLVKHETASINKLKNAMSKLISEQTVFNIEKAILGNTYQFFIENERAKIYNNLSLHEAAEDGHLEVVKVLLENGADVNHQNKHGETALIWAAGLSVHCEITKFLLENGADVNHQNKQGTTALMAAALSVHCERTKFLLENGADVNHQNKQGNTALIWAAKYGHLEVVKVLLENGTDVNHQNKDGNTALMVAALSVHCERTKFLLENGADVNHQNKQGDTALICAAKYGHLEVVKVLLENGADVNHQNKQGNTALIWAAKYGHLEVVKVLLENGTDPNKKNKKNETARSQAAEMGHTRIVEFLDSVSLELNKSEINSSSFNKSTSTITKPNVL